MRLALQLSGLGSGLITLGLRSGGPAVGTGWVLAPVEAIVGGELCLLGVLYGLRSTGWPVESWLIRPGWRGLCLRGALAPYRAYAGMVLLMLSRMGNERSFDEVAPGLFLGRRPSRRDGVGLARRGISCVLDLCIELPSRLDRAPTCLETKRAPILDALPPTADQFQEAVDSTLAWLAAGKGVLIHCAQGHGRSATIAAVVLVRLGRAVDLDEALDLIRRAQPGARPSRAQRRAAAEFLRGPAIAGG